jgi:hypothetical protein
MGKNGTINMKEEVKRKFDEEKIKYEGIQKYHISQSKFMELILNKWAESG